MFTVVRNYDTMKLLLTVEKKMVLYLTQGTLIYYYKNFGTILRNYETLIYYGKTMILNWKEEWDFLKT